MAQPIAAILLLCFLVAHIAQVVTGVQHDSDPHRNRRDAESSLIPFPRVGRSHLPYSWGPYSTRNMDERLKRDELIPFPRVGRSEPKRNGAGTSGALWFGPRLGKRHNEDGESSATSEFFKKLTDENDEARLEALNERFSQVF